MRTLGFVIVALTVMAMGSFGLPLIGAVPFLSAGVAMVIEGRN